MYRLCSSFHTPHRDPSKDDKRLRISSFQACILDTEHPNQNTPCKMDDKAHIVRFKYSAKIQSHNYDIEVYHQRCRFHKENHDSKISVYIRFLQIQNLSNKKDNFKSDSRMLDMDSCIVSNYFLS